MEFKPDLLTTGFTIIEIGLFYGREDLEAKICRFLTFLTKISKSIIKSLHDVSKIYEIL